MVAQLKHETNSTIQVQSNYQEVSTNESRSHDHLAQAMLEEFPLRDKVFSLMPEVEKGFSV
jgi:hypothetical protein